MNTFVRAVENKINEVKTQRRSATGTYNGTLSVVDSRLSNLFIKEPARLGVVGQKIRRRPNTTPANLTFFQPTHSSLNVSRTPRKTSYGDHFSETYNSGLLQSYISDADDSNRTTFRVPSPNKAVRAVRFNFSDSSIHEYQANDPIHIQHTK